MAIIMMSLDLKLLFMDYFVSMFQLSVLPSLEKIPAEYSSGVNVEGKLPLTSKEKDMTV